jgi:hypothetical protein
MHVPALMMNDEHVDKLSSCILYKHSEVNGCGITLVPGLLHIKSNQFLSPEICMYTLAIIITPDFQIWNRY